MRLYELVLENGRSASPFVWRIRYALAHKGIAYESVPLGFIEIPKVFGGRFNFTAERATRLQGVRDALLPLRQHLATHPFLGGEARAPNYADYLESGHDPASHRS